MSLTCVLCIYIFTALELSPAAQRAIRSLHYDHKPLTTLVLATLSGRVRQPAHTMKQMNHRLKQLEPEICSVRAGACSVPECHQGCCSDIADSNCSCFSRWSWLRCLECSIGFTLAVYSMRNMQSKGKMTQLWKNTCVHVVRETMKQMDQCWQGGPCSDIVGVSIVSVSVAAVGGLRSWLAQTRVRTSQRTTRTRLPSPSLAPTR